MTGEWDFTFGKLSLTQRDMDVTGTYQWYGDADAGKVTGVVVAGIDQFQGMWISNRNPSSQNLMRWNLAADRSSFSGATQDSGTQQQWCGVRSGQPLPAGCGFSGVWELHFADQHPVRGRGGECKCAAFLWKCAASPWDAGPGDCNTVACGGRAFSLAGAERAASLGDHDTGGVNQPAGQRLSSAID